MKLLLKEWSSNEEAMLPNVVKTLKINLTLLNHSKKSFHPGCICLLMSKLARILGSQFLNVQRVLMGQVYKARRSSDLDEGGGGLVGNSASSLKKTQLSLYIQN